MRPIYSSNIELMYYLLKAGRYYGYTRYPSETFMSITSKTDKYGVYLKFKDDIDPTLDWFNNFVTTNYDKIINDIFY